MIFHLLFQRMSGRRLLQHRGSDVLQRQTPGSFLCKKKKKKDTVPWQLRAWAYFGGGTGWHHTRCMGQAVTTGFCSSICPSTATSTPCPWSHTMSLILTVHPLGTPSCTAFPPGMGAARCHHAGSSQDT